MTIRSNDIVETQDPDAVRAQVREALIEDRISQAEGARRAGIAESTFAAWLAGKYQGNNEKATADALRWVDARRAQKVTAASITSSPGFIDTETAVTFMGAMQYAQVASDFTTIVGVPGVGKTQAAEAYQRRNPNVYVVTMEPSISSPGAMLGEICAELEIPEKSSTKQARAIRRFFKGKNALLIVDEAQHLTTKALDELRSLNDRGGVGVVAMGNPSILARLVGTGSDEFAQLHSRVGVGLTCQKPRDTDISALIAAWGVSDTEEVIYLTQIARKAGALRALDKTMRLASTLANGSGDARGLRHLKAARSKLGRSGAEA
ncbi:AAA family ATPase [Nitrospirillum amazonense]|uniref:AAA family ATPase n=1 Tax=Nitrospirillum amazonense TaxID=28077 RepID=UPI0024124692|nr:AAA family ATPase [Nitrospirillum amazonense]MDG3444688.1 AAA family ATPase [Nitrospirillum amazonense]